MSSVDLVISGPLCYATTYLNQQAAASATMLEYYNKVSNGVELLLAARAMAAQYAGLSLPESSPTTASRFASIYSSPDDVKYYIEDIFTLLLYAKDKARKLPIFCVADCSELPKPMDDR
jgi:hypothetical protein